MQSFNIIKENSIKDKSYRVSKVCDQFDFQKDKITEHFNGEIDIPSEWNIGVIVGKSGTGKSTIARELFKKYICEFNYKENCVIDDFDKNISLEEITKMFSAVGFASVPSWLKPYAVLSNGEKMRVDLARALLMNKDIIVFDEYTSVIDREVAQLGALATHNAIKKTNKKFIAITCHFDVIEWLQPDWIFSTDEMKTIQRGYLRRPEIKLEIRQIKGHWNIFRRYHYLDHNLHKAAEQYVAFYNNKPIGLCAVINFPHPRIKPMRKIHRIVILPDYQGLGIGGRLLDFVADIYYKKREYIGITTSLKNFGKSIMRNKKWKLQRYGRINSNKGMGNSLALNQLNRTISKNRNTYSFKYIGNPKH